MVNFRPVAFGGGYLSKLSGRFFQSKPISDVKILDPACDNKRCFDFSQISTCTTNVDWDLVNYRHEQQTLCMFRFCTTKVVQPLKCWHWCPTNVDHVLEALMPSFVRPFVGRTIHKFGGVLGAQVTRSQQAVFSAHAKCYGI